MVYLSYDFSNGSMKCRSCLSFFEIHRSKNNELNDKLLQCNELNNEHSHKVWTWLFRMSASDSCSRCISPHIWDETLEAVTSTGHLRPVCLPCPYALLSFVFTICQNQKPLNKLFQSLRQKRMKTDYNQKIEKNSLKVVAMQLMREEMWAWKSYNASESASKEIEYTL